LRADAGERVRQALILLSPEQRLVLELKFFQERTFEEIAAVVQAPLSTVKSRLYDGLGILKQHFARRK
jgi:RNA polymerase sigma-70 factor (ECF subfamily)